MSVSFLIVFPMVVICVGGWIAYEIYNAPECDEDGNPIRDDGGNAGAPEGDFAAVLRSRAEDAP